MKIKFNYQKIIHFFNNDFLIIFLIYSIAHGLIIFNQGIFGDDWCTNNKDFYTLIELFRQIGINIFGYLHYFLVSLPYSILIYHLLTFLLYFFSGWFIYLILSKIKELSRKERLLIVIFYLIFPANITRIAIITFPYSLCNLLFFLGFYLTTLYLENKKIILRILAQIFFLLSFLTNSILVFYLLVIIYLIYTEKSKIHSFKDLIIVLIRYFDFILLPFIFWIIKINYFAPYGYFKSYNHIIFRSIDIIFKRFTLAVNRSLFLPIKESFQLVPWYYFAIIIIIYPFILVQKRFSAHKNNISVHQKYHNLYFLLLGIFIFILAVLPYILVNRIPMWNCWSSRHQLLIPLGVSLMLVFLIKMIFQKKVRNMLYFSLIILFSVLYIKNYLLFQADWYKQLSIIENYRQNKIIREHTSFLIQDNYPQSNAMNRSYLSYESSGMMERAYGDESRFAVNYSFSPKYRRLERIVVYKQFFNIRDYKPKDFDYIIYINKGKYDINSLNTVKLMVFDYFFPKKFDLIIPAIVNIQTKQYNEKN